MKKGGVFWSRKQERHLLHCWMWSRFISCQVVLAEDRKHSLSREIVEASGPGWKNWRSNFLCMCTSAKLWVFKHRCKKGHFQKWMQPREAKTYCFLECLKPMFWRVWFAGNPWQMHEIGWQDAVFRRGMIQQSSLIFLMSVEGASFDAVLNGCSWKQFRSKWQVKTAAGKPLAK